MNRTIKSILLAMPLSVAAFAASAQDGIGDLLQANIEDATKLITAYVAPGAETISTGLASGWYNTAKPHKLGGFDLTIGVNMVRIPDNKLFYDFNSLNLQNVTLNSPSDGKIPTLFGPDITPNFHSNSADADFDGPSGLNLKHEIKMQAVPMPTVNLGIGLIKGTEIKIRYVPDFFNSNDAKFSYWGVAIMHDIKQYIPKVKSLPIDISFLAGLTKMKLDADISGDLNGENQRGVFDVSAATIQVIASKKISVLTFYGGVGYNITKTKLALNGWYDVDDDDVEDSGEVNPLSLDFPQSGPRITAGMRLKLAIFTFHVDYTVQTYNVLAVGFGFSVR